MSIQWSIIAGFLYTEIVVVLLLVLPIVSPTRWQRLFKSRFLQAMSNQASTYFLILLAVLVLFLLDAIREIRKYSSNDHVGDHHHLNSEMQGSMRLFRAQRNFYISGFALFLSVVIHRLVSLISAQAVLLAQSEAAMRQAQSATSTAKTLLSQRTRETAQNESNEAHNKAVSELKNQIKELQERNSQLSNDVTKEKKDKEALKSQAEALAKEYDRLTEDHAKLVRASGDKKSD